MKKNIKKYIALILLGFTFCGSVLTTQASANGNCYTHQGVKINTGSHTNTYEHTHAGKKCKVEQKFKDYKIVCTKCGAVLSTGSDFNGETHTVQ